jgi:hypothetical protein
VAVVRWLVAPALVAAIVFAGTPAGAQTADSWPGKPGSPPPSLGAGTKGPPPAWIESKTRSWWLAYSSYCWKTTCADFLPPQGRPDLPAISVRRGLPLRLHLGFRPRQLSISVNGKQTRLAAAQVAQFKPSGSGIVIVSARPAAGGGDASYVARLRVASFA